MKFTRTILFMTFIASLIFKSENLNAANVVFADSLNASQVMVEASLFFEAYKNKQYEMWTIEKGFNVINNDPNFQNNKYTIYRKLDKVIFEVYQDSTITDETKKVLADTAMYLYDMGIKYDPEYAGTYMVKKGYVLSEWLNVPVEESIAAYEEAFASEKEITNLTYYMDKLGNLYIANMNDSNDYKMKALDVYLKLADIEPENTAWTIVITKLAEDEEQLKDFMQKAWYADKENTEKAWKYARACKKIGDYEAEIEPLSFLIEKNPDVINYWVEIAKAYQKNGQNDLAADSYKELIKLQPDNGDHYINIALVYKDMGQLSVARSYLQKASRVRPDWEYPIYIEGTLYEQSARECGFEFEDKCVYQLAVDTYRRAANMGGEHSQSAAERVSALSNSVPTKEDYFFRKMKNGDVIKIEGKCYDWIGKSITVSL